ncbi:MAG: T9SS type A sorting domain-containing protein [Chitinophagales bacterium]|nr:T9SS type A sorting domain-containing protein [Chitinophagales bacterium]
MKKTNNTLVFKLWSLLLGVVLSLGTATTASAQCTLVCNNLVQISLDEDCVVTVLPDMILEGNGCPNGNLVVEMKINGAWVPATVNINHVNQTIQVRVRDLNSGNNCWGYMHIEDKLAPIVDCTDITLSCVVTNHTPSYIANTLGITEAFPDVIENCDNTPTLTYIDTYVDLNCTQTINGQSDISAYILRKWTAVDQSGNSATCNQYIYFERRHMFDVLFPADVTVSCSNPSTDPSVTGSPFIDDFGFDWDLYPNNTACELNVAYTDQLLPVCDGTYKILRTWVVLDWCKPTSTNPNPQFTNPVYHIQLIKVEDAAGPQFDCPENLTVSTDPYNCCATVNLPDVIMEDNCSRINSISAMVTTFDPQTGTQTGMYTVGGFLSTFPGNNLWTPDTLANYGTTPCLHIGTHRVVYTATDDCGNARTCSFNLTVEDQTPPEPVCTQLTKVSIGANGEVLVNATAFDQGSEDNCGDVYFKVRRMNSGCGQSNSSFLDQVKFCCEDIGDTITVILRVYDVQVPAGSVTTSFQEEHSNDCMIQVIVEDKLKPICQAPVNMTVNCESFDPSLWAYGQAIATDNCCIDTVITTASYTQFDTVCNRGTITRTFRAIDCGGQSSVCTQRVVVTYRQDYWVRFPNDVIVTVCDGSGTYGEPTFFGENCELLATSYTDELFTVVPDACFKIERTWKVINWCTYDPNQGCIAVPNPNPNAITNSPQNLPGPIVSPVGTPAPWAPTVVSITPGAPATNYGAAYWNANFANNNLNVNCYTYKQIIKVIDTQAPTAQCPASPVEFCDLTPNNGGLWNEMYYWDNRTESHDLCEGPSDLTLTATDACSGANINIEYLLFLDLDGNGSMETVVSSVNLPGFNRVNYNNAGNPNFSGGTAYAFDERPVPGNQKYGFAIQKVKSGNNLTANVRWNTAQSPTNYVIPELPYGTHKIKWFITDGCGNNRECEYTFVVKDCKKPTVVCLNGLSVNIMQTGMVSLWASDFLQYTEDNCTPTDKLKIGIVRSEQSTGSFPVDGNGNPLTEVQFTCADTDIEPELVQLWSIDLAGNADFCETYVLVQDNMGNCGGPKPTVAGYLKTEGQQGVEDAQVDLQGSSPAVPPFSMFQNTLETGKYEFSNAVPVASNLTITPVEDDNHINGVSTFDLVLISKHILGIEPLTSPYKMIAADANKSGSITTFDIVELRKLVLGVYTELPANTSWRFIDKAYSFPNPSNPFAAVFPENKSVASISNNLMSEDFVAVKVGDLNGNAVANSLMQSEDRSAGTLYFDVQDRAVNAGETFDVTFKAAEQVQGFQFTLNFPGLEVVDVTGLKAENFAVFAADKAMTTSVDGENEFTVRFRATQAGQISKLMGVSSSITKAEAYNNNSDRLDVAIRFNGSNGSVVAGAGFEVFQNTPNPVAANTTISFNLPEAAEATLTISTIDGRVVRVVKGNYAKGLNSITLNRSDLAAGVLFYQVETATHSATKKMVVTE